MSVNSNSEFFFDPFWHVIVIFTFWQKNTSSVFHDWVFSAPKHHHVVFVRFGNDDPWFSLIEAWVPVNEVAWIWNGHRWNDSDVWLTFFKSVDPGHIVNPLLGRLVEAVPIVLAWETVIMMINTFNNPPFSFDGRHVSQVSLSIVNAHFALSIIRNLWLTLMSINALRKICEKVNITFHGLFDLTVEKRSWFSNVSMSHAVQGVSAHWLGKAFKHICCAVIHHADKSAEGTGLFSNSIYAHIM